jgi:hypothetical protein
MRKTARAVALLSLAFLSVPPLLFLTGRMSLEQVKSILPAVTAVWFVSAGMWIWHKNVSGRSKVGSK